MMNAIVIAFRFLLRHKFKIFAVINLIIIFLIILFPMSDLNDTVSTYVSKTTNNRVYIQFDKMHLNPFTASLSFDKLLVETPQISTLVTDELSFSPSITALFSQKPGGTLSAKGILKGEVTVHLVPTSSGSSSTTSSATNKNSKSSKSENKGSTPELKVDRYKIDAQAQNLSLKEIKEVMGLSLPIKGSLNLITSANADINFIEQPEMDLTLTINRFELPPSSVSFQSFGRISLPEIKLNQIELKGKLANGKFQIETGKIGNNKDDFFGEIKGDIEVTIQVINGQPTPQFNSYNLSVEMKANTAFKEKAKFYLSFLDGYKKDLPDGTIYKMKIQASTMDMPPQITPLQ